MLAKLLLEGAGAGAGAAPKLTSPKRSSRPPKALGAAGGAGAGAGAGVDSGKNEGVAESEKKFSVG